jgi:putative endonuclease
LRPCKPPESTRAVGARAERRALLHYLIRGYRVIGTNVRAAAGEIDLIVRRGQVLVFCEVKTKLGDQFGDPAEMVDAEKQRRLRRTARAWLAANTELALCEVRFDVVAVRGGRLRRVPNAF